MNTKRANEVTNTTAKANSIFNRIWKSIENLLRRWTCRTATDATTANAPAVSGASTERTKPKTFCAKQRWAHSKKVNRHRHFSPTRRAGLYGCVDARLAAGDGHTALKLLAGIARKTPTAYSEMADVYEDGIGMAADARVAKRYARLAKNDIKAARQLARRQKRQIANLGNDIGFVDVHNARNLIFAHALEQCAKRVAERAHFRRHSSRARRRNGMHAMRLAA